MADLKFCPECGNPLTKKLNFCQNCGFKLPTSENHSTITAKNDFFSPENRLEKKTADTKIEKSNDFSLNTDIQALGKNFENVVEKIFIAEGYVTEKRKRMPGKSGYTNEIDVIAIKHNDKIAIECKNYLSPVSIDRLRNFSEMVRDLGNQWRGVFASYNTFTSDAVEFAQDRHIELLSHDEIKERLYAALSGRSAQQGDKIYIEDALPIYYDYFQVTNLNLLNKDKISVYSARLVFHPYMLYQYEIKHAYYSKENHQSRVFKRNGSIIINLIDNGVLFQDPLKENDIQNYKSEKSLAIAIDQNYRVIKIEPKYHKKAIFYSAINNVIERYIKKEDLPFVLKRGDVTLDLGQPVYLPKWEILFDAFGKIYKREILACSGGVILDTITYCPNHLSFFGKKILKSKNVAACEECGEAFCESHGTQCSVCGKWICNNHTITCSVCKKTYCRDHIHQSCTLCKDYVCASCLFTCPTCNSIVGSNHFIKCDYCGQVNCENCISNSGVVMKKNYCRDKCDLIVKEEIAKKGFFGKLIKKI